METPGLAIRAAALTAAVVWLPWVLGSAAYMYILGGSDSKFGRDGAVIFVAGMWGLMAIVAAGTCAVAHLVAGVWRHAAQGWRFWGTVTGAAVLLCGLTLAAPFLPPLAVIAFGEIGGIVATWAAICGVVQVAGVLYAYESAT